MKRYLVPALISVVLLLVCYVVYNETQKPDGPSPRNSVMPARQNWKDTFGDTERTEIYFNLAVLRTWLTKLDQKVIVLHPEPDPNVPTLESRVEELECLNEERDRYSGNNGFINALKDLAERYDPNEVKP